MKDLAAILAYILSIGVCIAGLALSSTGERAHGLILLVLGILVLDFAKRLPH